MNDQLIMMPPSSLQLLICRLFVAKERAEREATRRQKEQDAIDDFKFKSTNANLDEFSKEHYLQVDSMLSSLPTPHEHLNMH